MWNNNDEDFPTTSWSTWYQENGFSWDDNRNFPTRNENTQRVEFNDLNINTKKV